MGTFQSISRSTSAQGDAPSSDEHHNLLRRSPKLHFQDLFGSWVRAAFFILSGVLEALGQTTLPITDTYRLWAEGNWGSAVVGDSSQREFMWGEGADPDHDGVKNLIEYALGTDPKVVTSIPSPEFTSGEQGRITGVQIDLLRRKDDPSLVIIPQVTDGTGSWQPSPPPNTFTWTGEKSQFIKILSDDKGNGYVREIHSYPFDVSDRKATFARLLVKRNGTVATTSQLDNLRLPETITGTPGSLVESVSLIPTGFTGSLMLTVDEGADLIVDGENRGRSAIVTANSRVFLRTSAPLSVGQQSSYTLNFGGLHSTVWDVLVRSPLSPSLVAGQISGYSPVRTDVGANGASEISIPISVPPGTAGMEPQLSLTYSSQAAYGLLGKGFALAGTSQISRTGATKFFDGFKGGVNFDQNDRYQFDGQRLILSSGVWGASNSEYRTQIETFSRLRLLPNGDGTTYWEIKTKAGLTVLLGATPNSRVSANRFVGDPAVLSWSLSEISDNNGNKILFRYALPTGEESGTARLESISYTENSSAKPPLEAGSKIAFEYESRPDVYLGFVSGAKISITKRLRAIECSHAGIVARRYDLIYQQSPDSGVSQLRQVNEKARSSSSALTDLPPVKLAWLTNGSPLKLKTPKATGAIEKVASAVGDYTADFTGDGMTDFLHWNHDADRYDLYPAGGDGSWKKLIATQIIGYNDNKLPNVTASFIGDFNGDGKMDVMSHNRTRDVYQLYLANGAGFDAAIVTNVIPYREGKNVPVITGDFDGDGRTDFLVWRNMDAISQTPYYYMYLSLGDRFKRVDIFMPSWENESVIPQQIAGDFNGDGCTDLLMWHVPGKTSRYNLYTSKGDGTFEAAITTNIETWDNPLIPNLSGDFNGDGLTDVMVWHKPYENNQYNIYYSTGRNGLFAVSASGVKADDDPRVLLHATNDFNGDGLMDAFMWEEKLRRYLIYPATSNGRFGPSINSGIPSFLDPEAAKYIGFRPNLLGDFNGDGRSDCITWRVPLSNWNYNVILSDGVQPDLISRVTYGHGLTTAFQYKPLTDPSVYSKGGTAVYPQIDLQAATYVVSSISSRNGIDGDPYSATSNLPESETGFSAKNYLYAGARMHLDGRGFQGFESIQVTDEATGLVVKTEYNTSHFALAGKPVKKAHTTTGGRVIKRENTQWSYKRFPFTNNGKTETSYFPILVDNVSDTYEVNRAIDAPPVTSIHTHDFKYDNFGNFVQSIKDFGNGFGETTVSYYSDNIDKWWLGRLERTVTTQAAPDAVGVVKKTSKIATFEYSPATGQLSREVISTSDNSLRLDTAYERDAYGNVTITRATDGGTGETRVSINRFSSDGRFVVQAENGLGQVLRQNHDPLNGEVVWSSDPNGLETRVDLDALGRPVRQVAPDGIESLTQHLLLAPGASVPARTVHGVLAQTAGLSWRYTYFDLLNREIGGAAPHFNGQLVFGHNVFNKRGELERTSLPYLGNQARRYTDVAYDAVSRQIRETAPGNRQTTTSYDGLVTTVTNPLNQDFKTYSDERGRVKQSTSFGSQSVKTEHDPYGNLVALNDGHGQITRMDYNIRGFRTSLVEPNSGTTTFKHNAFGEVIEQRDALGRTIRFQYDALGRMTRRDEPEGITVWEYDTAPNGIGKLCRMYRLADSYQESYRYDRLSRLVGTEYSIGNARFIVGCTYDEYGRMDSTIYPSGFAVRNHYNGDGYLLSVSDAYSGKVFWNAITFDANGQITEEDFGNGLTSRRTYDPITDYLASIRTGKRSGGDDGSLIPDVQNLAYSFNAIGNLIRREDLNRQMWEAFDYDASNRLNKARSNSYSEQAFTFDILGNIKTKSGVGAYSYGQGGAPPSAVTTIRDTATGQAFRTLQYDAAGNCIRNGSTRISYNTSNQPTDLTSGEIGLRFAYSPSRARYRLIERDGDKERVKLYLGNLYELETDSEGNTTHTHFIAGGSGVVAIHTVKESSASAVVKTRYVHKDHLGSIQSLTREDGTAEETLNFDPWGRRMRWDAASKRLTYDMISSQSDRGFTGHEMLDSLGLVHMNGRLYDPLVGRFMSSDPFVQEPKNLQSLNRYSYVCNNPLSLTDPSGFWAEAIGFDRLIQNENNRLQGWMARKNGQIPTIIINALPLGSAMPTVASFLSDSSTGSGYRFETDRSIIFVEFNDTGDPDIGSAQVLILSETYSQTGGANFCNGGLTGAFSVTYRHQNDSSNEILAVASGVLEFVPYVSAVQGVYIYTFQSNPITGDYVQRSESDLALSLVPGGKSVKYGKKVINEVRGVGKYGDDVVDAAKNRPGTYRPERSLPRDKHGNPIPDTGVSGAHTQLGSEVGRKGEYTKAREFDTNGKPVRDIEFTDHGRPNNPGHTNPHQHLYLPNPTGGTPQRGPAQPYNW